MITSLRSSITVLLAVAGIVSTADAGSLRTSRALGATYTQSSDYASKMLESVNKERAAQGLSSLCLNTKLMSSAARHSNDMAESNYMAHDGSDGSTMEQRITAAGFIWTAVGENVAAGQEDVDAVMTSWMNSPEHKANILGDYKMFGTAYAYNANTEYKHYWTQDFGTGDAETCEGSTASSGSTDQTQQTAQQDTAASSDSQSTDQTQQQDQVAGDADTTAETTAPITMSTPGTTAPTPATTVPSATTAPTQTPSATTATPSSGCKAKK